MWHSTPQCRSPYCWSFVLLSEGPDSVTQTSAARALTLRAQGLNDVAIEAAVDDDCSKVSGWELEVFGTLQGMPARPAQAYAARRAPLTWTRGEILPWPTTSDRLSTIKRSSTLPALKLKSTCCSSPGARGAVIFLRPDSSSFRRHCASSGSRSTARSRLPRHLGLRRSRSRWPAAPNVGEMRSGLRRASCAAGLGAALG